MFNSRKDNLTVSAGNKAAPKASRPGISRLPPTRAILTPSGHISNPSAFLANNITLPRKYSKFHVQDCVYRGLNRERETSDIKAFSLHKGYAVNLPEGRITGKDLLYCRFPKKDGPDFAGGLLQLGCRRFGNYQLPDFVV